MSNSGVCLAAAKTCAQVEHLELIKWLHLEILNNKSNFHEKYFFLLSQKILCVMNMFQHYLNYIAKIDIIIKEIYLYLIELLFAIKIKDGECKKYRTIALTNFYYKIAPILNFRQKYLTWLTGEIDQLELRVTLFFNIIHSFF